MYLLTFVSFLIPFVSLLELYKNKIEKVYVNKIKQYINTKHTI